MHCILVTGTPFQSYLPSCLIEGSKTWMKMYWQTKKILPYLRVFISAGNTQKSGHGKLKGNISWLIQTQQHRCCRQRANCNDSHSKNSNLMIYNSCFKSTNIPVIEQFTQLKKSEHSRMQLAISAGNTEKQSATIFIMFSLQMPIFFLVQS